MFGKFMNKKFFHPGSYPNIKQKWIHEQRAAAKDKCQEEKQSVYQKEQESYQSRMLSAKSDCDKMKLKLNFMYDLPPGMKKQEEEESAQGAEEVKFAWQKTAPRSKYINDLGLECQDQPFGVCVRNIRCFKCRGWGHQNTDRECPLFLQDINSESNTGKNTADSLRFSDPMRLVADMKKQHGITLKKSVIGEEIDPMADNQQLLMSDEENSDLEQSDLAYIESLTDKQKKKLLKSLNKLEKSKKKKVKKKKNNDLEKQFKSMEKYKKIDNKTLRCNQINNQDKHDKKKEDISRKRKHSEVFSERDEETNRQIAECRHLSDYKNSKGSNKGHQKAQRYKQSLREEYINSNSCKEAYS